MPANNIKVDSTLELIICKYYEEGIGVMQLSKKFSLDRETIRNTLLRGSKKYLQQRKIINKDDQAKHREIVKDLWNKNFGIVEISNITNKRPCNIVLLLYKLFGKENIKKKRFHYPKSSRKWNLNENYFNIIDTEAKAYFLGILYADGNLCRTRFITHIYLQGDDKHILESFLNELEYNKPLKFKKGGPRKGPNGNPIVARDGYEITINSVRLYRALLTKGLHPNKSFTIRFPDDSILKKELVRHFIRGFMDGDGYVASPHSMPSIGFTSNEVFCNELKTIIEETLNIHVGVGKVTGGRIYTAKIGGALQFLKFGHWIYDNSTIFLYRKKRNFDQRIIDREKKKKLKQVI